MRKLFATKRGKAMIIAGIISAAASGWGSWKADNNITPETITPAAIHQALDEGVTPPSVEVAIALIAPWEGMRTEAYVDPVGVVTICLGETVINGKPVKLGMRMTEKECRQRFVTRVTRDYYLPLVDNVKDFVRAPIGVQSAAISVAYNAGTGAITRKTSTSGNAIRARDYPGACIALTAFNKGRVKGKLVVLPGLDNRRTMGDDYRVGEAEVCLNTEVKG